ncbi:MAG: hypothetical protein JNN07_00615 [Verrucomicrobiales bacterium]|nr:hypothetical protein [Verrucomicrobiales bacterium]
MLHKILLVLVAWVTSSSVALAVTNEPVRVFMPDGQFKSHLLRVFVTKDLTQADKPVLSLLSGEYLLKQRANGFAQEAPAVEVARFQNWTEQSPTGIHIPHTGTLLLFDLRATPFPFIKACIRPDDLHAAQVSGQTKVNRLVKDFHHPNYGACSRRLRWMWSRRCRLCINSVTVLWSRIAQGEGVCP